MRLTLDILGWRLTVGAEPISSDAPTVDGSGTTSSYPIQAEARVDHGDVFGFSGSRHVSGGSVRAMTEPQPEQPVPGVPDPDNPQPVDPAQPVQPRPDEVDEDTVNR